MRFFKYHCSDVLCLLLAVIHAYCMVSKCCLITRTSMFQFQNNVTKLLKVNYHFLQKALLEVPKLIAEIKALQDCCMIKHYNTHSFPISI